MTSSGQNVSRSRWLITALTVGLVICVGGICSLFAQTNTEHNAEKALKELQIDTTIDEPNIPIPEIYETPPKIVEQIVGGAPEFKLFYFCKHHTSDELKKIVHEQFATKLFKLCCHGNKLHLDKIFLADCMVFIPSQIICLKI